MEIVASIVRVVRPQSGNSQLSQSGVYTRNED